MPSLIFFVRRQRIRTDGHCEKYYISMPSADSGFDLDKEAFSMRRKLVVVGKNKAVIEELFEKK